VSYIKSDSGTDINSLINSTLYNLTKNDTNSTINDGKNLTDDSNTTSTV